MRSACSLMTLRKRSRACASSFAAPCSVSTKPLSEASGVRSSWLALATKSARMRASRSCSLRSRNEMRSAGPSAPDRDGSSGATVASRRRSTGTRSCSSTEHVAPETRAWSTAASSSGVAAHGGDVAAAPPGAEQVLGHAVGVHDIAGVVEHDGRLRHGVDHHAPQPVAAGGRLGGRPRARIAVRLLGRPQHGPGRDCGEPHEGDGGRQSAGNQEEDGECQRRSQLGAPPP